MHEDILVLYLNRQNIMAVNLWVILLFYYICMKTNAKVKLDNFGIARNILLCTNGHSFD